MYAANGNIEKSVGYGYTYGDATKGEIPDTVYKVTYDGKDFLSYTYDSLGRLSQRKVGATSEKYTYKNNADGTTTPRVDVYTTIAGLDISYEYDANGNITHISGEADENYTYDSQNRLIRMDHQYMGITETYDYDDRGNILSRKRYDYTTGDINYQPIEIINYGYTDATWADLMTEYNGQSISYDALGNPLEYRDGMSMTWEMGRRLSTLTKDGFTNTYTYNADGLRMSKTTSEGTTTYFIIDGEYVGEETYIDGVCHVTMYLYDDKGTVVGINADGEVYYMVKNVQGDVTGLVDKNGNRAAYYDYDPWGAPDGCYDGNGNYITAKDHIAYRNPFRYRGYMYDAETGLYYLNSRYYDPITSRFVNADALVTTGQGFDGNNMFAYCENNPVNRFDPTGNFAIVATAATVTVCGIAAWKIATLFVAGVTALAALDVGIHNPPTTWPSISLPEEEIIQKAKVKEEEKEKEKDIAQPPRAGTTYYHATTIDNVLLIVATGTMIGSTYEGGHVFAWRSKPNKYAIANSGARSSGVIISFKTNAAFVDDTGIKDEMIRKYSPVISDRPGPIKVWDVEIVG